MAESISPKILAAMERARLAKEAHDREKQEATLTKGQSEQTTPEPDAASASPENEPNKTQDNTAAKEAKQTDSTKRTGEQNIISLAEYRLETFKAYNGRLVHNKSQIPNLAVQAKIFEPVSPGRRKFYKDWVDVSVSGRDDIKVQQRYTQLNQYDLTAWLLLIRFAGPDMIARFTRYEFLKAAKRHNSGREYSWLRDTLDRLRGTDFCITLQNKYDELKYRGHLVTQEIEKNANLYAIQISEPLSTMFGADGWSFINLGQRLALGKSQRAMAFHAFLSTQRCPEKGFWWKKDTLWQEWGPEYKTRRAFMRNFRRRVLKPLYDINFIEDAKETETAICIKWRKKQSNNKDFKKLEE